MSKISNFDDIYTLEDLDSYGKRLHINTALVLTLNIFTGYVVVKFSTDSMGRYKSYVLLTIIAATLMDFHASFIYGIFPLFPLPGFCSAGVIARHMDYFWGEIVQYIIVHETLSFCGNSLLISAFYRYAVMKNNVKFFHSFKGITIITLYILLYPTIPALTLIYNTDPRDVTLQYVKDNAPNVYELYKNAPCSTLTFEKCIIYVITIFVHVVFILFVGTFIMFKTFKIIALNKHCLSSHTYRMYRQFVISLLLQLTVPFIFVFLPTMFCVFAVLLNMQNIKGIAINVLQGFFLHSAFNSLCILFVIKPYREGAKAILLKPFFCYTHKQRNVVTPANSTHIKDTVMIA